MQMKEGQAKANGLRTQGRMPKAMESQEENYDEQESGGKAKGKRKPWLCGS